MAICTIWGSLTCADRSCRLLLVRPKQTRLYNLRVCDTCHAFGPTFARRVKVQTTKRARKTRPPSEGHTTALLRSRISRGATESTTLSRDASGPRENSGERERDFSSFLPTQSTASSSSVVSCSLIWYGEHWFRVHLSEHG